MPARIDIIATGRQTPSNNLSALIDVVWFYQEQTRILGNGCIQINDRAILPKNCCKVPGVAVESITDDLMPGINSIRNTKAIAIPVQISNPTIFP